MLQSRHCLFALTAWVCCLVAGGLSAQQPASGGQAGMATKQIQRSRPLPMRNGERRTYSETSQSTSFLADAPSSAAKQQPPQQQQPVGELSYMAVIGAVKSPTVFETSEHSVPLHTLIERAGGETRESLGSIRIMERGVSRFSVTIQSGRDQPITNGQIVFVTPRGGRPAHVVDPRQPLPDRLILISGLARGPLLFNIGNQSKSFGDLLVTLGQSPEMVANQQVTATAPQGMWMDLDSLLVHNTVVHFDSHAVNIDGVQSAIQRGFQFEIPAKLDVSAGGPAASPTPVEVPGNAPPVSVPRPSPVRMTPPVPVTSDESNAMTGSGIEPAGSSVPVREPMAFPAASKSEAEVNQPPTSDQSDGRVRLMLPRNWPNPDDSESETEDPARVIERTSAGVGQQTSHIVTVAAEIEEVQPHLASRRLAIEPISEGMDEEATPLPRLTSAGGPPSWAVLLAVVGVAASSVFASRHLSREEAHLDETLPVAEEPLLEPTVASIHTAAESENDQRFLQRLIMNKVPLIEEEASVPVVERLHGMSVGGKKLVVHEAHEGVAGPHFKVRDRHDTRELELKLRQLMRAGRTPSSDTAAKPELVHATNATERDVPGPHRTKTSPLERALRTVDQGVTQ